MDTFETIQSTIYSSVVDSEEKKLPLHHDTEDSHFPLISQTNFNQLTEKIKLEFKAHISSNPFVGSYFENSYRYINISAFKYSVANYYLCIVKHA